jgi:hypothetical protein
MTYRAFVHVALDSDYRIRKARGLAIRKVKHGEGVSCRGLGADTGNFSEFLDKTLYR